MGHLPKYYEVAMFDYSKLYNEIPGKVFHEIPGVITIHNIDNALRLSHFLAQCAHESNNFTANEEDLNYSKEGLLKIFAKYFDEDSAEESARNPEKIANKVYGGRLGNTAPGDGFKYRGRGYIQLTGKANYENFGKTVSYDVVTNPDLVAWQYPLMSAAWFWSFRNINSVSDRGFNIETVKAVTKLVNGGINGIDYRVMKFKRFFEILR